MKINCYVCKVFTASFIALIILSLFCLIYTYEGIHISSSNGSTDYIWESDQFKSTMKEGFSWLRMDSNGYNNIYEYDSIDILLMGSSHMEALQVSKKENTGYLLNSLLAPYNTYNIGISGHTVYRCVDNLENAIEEFNPQKYVVMVIDSVDLSIEEMEKVISGEAKPIPSYDNGMIYYLQKIPAIKTIFKQLSDWSTLNNDKSTSQDDDSSISDNVIPNEYSSVLDEFLEKANSIVKANDNELIIVYQPSQIIDATGEVEYGYSEDYLNIFEDKCIKNDIVFCDMTESFNSLLYEEYRLAHGFPNSSIGEGHLNKYGHSAVASEVARIIKELESE